MIAPHLSWISECHRRSQASSSRISEYRNRTGSFSKIVICAMPSFSIWATSSGQMLSWLRRYSASPPGFSRMVNARRIIGWFLLRDASGVGRADRGDVGAAAQVARVDGVQQRVVVELGAGRLAHEPPPVEHEDAVGEARELRQLGGPEQDDATLRREPADEHIDLPLRADVHAAGRVIEQHHARCD